MHPGAIEMRYGRTHHPTHGGAHQGAHGRAHGRTRHEKRPVGARDRPSTILPDWLARDPYDRFFWLMENARVADTVYVYRLAQGGHVVRPFAFKTDPDPQVLETLQADGGGAFRIMVRRGRILVFSEVLHVAARSEYS